VSRCGGNSLLAGLSARFADKQATSAFLMTLVFCLVFKELYNWCCTLLLLYSPFISLSICFLFLSATFI